MFQKLKEEDFQLKINKKSHENYLQKINDTFLLSEKIFVKRLKEVVADGKFLILIDFKQMRFFCKTLAYIDGKICSNCEEAMIC